MVASARSLEIVVVYLGPRRAVKGPSVVELGAAVGAAEYDDFLTDRVVSRREACARQERSGGIQLRPFVRSS